MTKFLMAAVVLDLLAGATLARTAPRELITDRPDRTESPITVDQGWFQVEADLLAVRIEGVETTWLPAFTNLKYGLSPTVDLQLVVEPARVNGRVQPAVRLGDVQLRLKKNLWGPEGSEPSSLGVMPYLRFPVSAWATGGAGAIDGGVLVPLALDLGGAWGLGLMGQVDWRQLTHHWEAAVSVALGRDVWKTLAAYVELFAAHSWEPGVGWIPTFDFGFTYGLTPHVQLDLGCNLGLTPAADDAYPFLGLSAKF